MILGVISGTGQFGDIISSGEKILLTALTLLYSISSALVLFYFQLCKGIFKAYKTAKQIFYFNGSRSMHSAGNFGAS